METRTVTIDGQEVVQRAELFEIGFLLAATLSPSKLWLLVREAEKQLALEGVEFVGYEILDLGKGPVLNLVSRKWVTL